MRWLATHLPLVAARGSAGGWRAIAHLIQHTGPWRNTCLAAKPSKRPQGAHLPRPRAQLLPHRTCGQLVGFYYGVWKERAHPRARAWYQRLAEVCAPLP